MNLRKKLATVVLVAAAVARIRAAADSSAPVLEAPRILAANEADIGRTVPDLEFAPVSGNAFRLSQFKSAPAIVIAFTSTSCPVAKRYAPTLAAIEREYARAVSGLFL